MILGYLLMGAIIATFIVPALHPEFAPLSNMQWLILIAFWPVYVLSWVVGFILVLPMFVKTTLKFVYYKIRRTHE
jgi:hypothetical protein